MSARRDSTIISTEIPNDVSFAELKIHDAYNNQGLLQTYSLNTGSNSVSVNVSGLVSGMYIVTVEVDGVVVTESNLIVIH